MIQRIQTVFYILSAICFGLLFVFPFATSTEAIPQLLADQEYNIQDHIVLIAMSIIGILATVIAIGMYKKRNGQVKLGYLAIVISILIPLVAFLLMYNENTAIQSDQEIDDGIGLYLPVFSLLFAILGNRAVKKDEKLVRSMDRLR